MKNPVAAAPGSDLFGFRSVYSVVNGLKTDHGTHGTEHGTRHGKKECCNARAKSNMSAGPKLTRLSAVVFVTAVFVAAFSVWSQVKSSEMPNQPSQNLTAPRIVIIKAARKLQIFDGRKLIKTYTVALGFSTKGDKEVEGDGRTPEGEFYVFTKNPESRFHLSLGVSYPAKDDAKRGLSGGLITKDEHDQIVKAIDEGSMSPQKTRLGGEIYIHGGGIDDDWTDGCVALKDEEISEIFAMIPVGTKVKILK